MNSEVIITLLKKNIIELILIVSATFISLFVFFLYYRDTQQTPPDVLSVEHSKPTPDAVQETYSIDVSGAVKNPNVYEMESGSRIKDVIDKAGGFATDADTSFVAKNMNLAQLVSDQQKIYIPSLEDTKNGEFHINTEIASSPTSPRNDKNSVSDTNKISINSASAEELDILPGIGPTTAKKIIDNRPYSAIDELLTKKVTSVSTFDKIKDLIEL